MAHKEADVKLRRVITGHNDRGKSTILIDGPPGETLSWAAGALHEIWGDGGEAIDRNDPADRGAGPVVLEPCAGGAKVRWFVTHPFGDDISDEQKLSLMNEAFDEMEGGRSRVDLSSHPGMHLTKTMDIVIVQRGRIKLILEEGETILGPGDVVIQRGTNHAWEAVGDEPAVCLGVLIDRELKA